MVRAGKPAVLALKVLQYIQVRLKEERERGGGQVKQGISRGVRSRGVRLSKGPPYMQP